MTNSLTHWSEYWKAGNLTSLPQDFVENYDGEIAAFWNATFATLPNHGKLIDLCTGNGAVAILAGLYSIENGKDFNVVGIDAAKLSKKNLLQKYSHLEKLVNSIEFIDGCRVEEISLPSSEFDLITSQYGIEYSDWSKSAHQISRLLKQGGSFVFISHACSTDILSYMQQENDDYSKIMKAGFFRTFELYFSGKKSHRETSRNLTKVINETQLTLKHSNSPLLAGVLDFLQQIIRLDKQTFMMHSPKIESYYQQHIHAFSRLKDILYVSKRIKENPDWYLEFEKKGLELIESGDILQHGVHNAGAFYKFKKRTDIS